MRTIVTRRELDDLAGKVGLQVHRECGGFRVVKDGKNIFPDCGVCPVATKVDCLIFLKGVFFGRMNDG
jgi:hypothetical protein